MSLIWTDLILILKCCSVSTMLNEVHMLVPELDLFSASEKVWFHTLYRFLNCRKLLWKIEFSFFNVFVCTSQVPLSDIICQRRLTLFGHVACMDTHIDTRCLLTAPVPDASRGPSSRPRQSWPSNILSDLSQLNLFFSEVFDRASNRLEWRNLSRSRSGACCCWWWRFSNWHWWRFRFSPLKLGLDDVSVITDKCFYFITIAFMCVCHVTFQKLA